MTVGRHTITLLCLGALLAGCSPAAASVSAGPPGDPGVATGMQPPLTGSGPASHGPPRPGPSSSPSPSATSVPSGPVRPDPTGTLHYIANTEGVAAVMQLGYNLVDTGPDPDELATLPAGTQALVWLGSLDNDACASPSYTFAQFTAAVDRLVGDPRVYGYFIADEPHPKVCPNAVADIRARADYIDAHDPTHKSFIVVLDGTNQCGGTYGCEFDAFRPSASHVDLIGLDPYPCNVNSSTCEYSKIDDTVHRAEAHGIPASVIVPVFQAFGQACTSSPYYRLPSAAEMRTMLKHWSGLIAHPAFDYAYSWGHQGSSCPTLVDSAALQAVLRTHNLG
jgi:hypothetical protein